MMNKNTRIAKELVRLAKSLVADMNALELIESAAKKSGAIHVWNNNDHLAKVFATSEKVLEQISKDLSQSLNHDKKISSLDGDLYVMEITWPSKNQG